MDRLLTLDQAETAQNAFGSCNSHLDIIGETLGVSIDMTSDGLRISGDPESTILAEAVCRQLYEIGSQSHPITAQMATYLAELARDGDLSQISGFAPDYVCVTARGRPVHCKTIGQRDYVQAIRNHDLTFATGPAGTGKTFLAVAMAVHAFRAKECGRIILTRPAVEAGEKLGFLPGDLQNKVDPYMRPLYDALHEMMGAEQYARNLERGLIEVSPLAYMRGRTLDDAFVILDEAQNTTPEQMKMFLTRLGFHTKAVVTGDLTQIDLPPHQRCGLREAVRILAAVEGLAFVELTRRDVVRNPLVSRIIQAYENEAKKEGDVT